MISELKIPLKRAILLSSIVFIGFSAVSISIGLATGLLVWAPTMDQIVKTSLIALLVPSLFEELVFRGPLLLPAIARRWRWMAPLLISAFVMWHVVEAKTFLPQAAPIFLTPSFLVIAGLFGIAATYITLQTRRLWPAILMHWLMVVGWKQMFGGPQLVTP